MESTYRQCAISLMDTIADPDIRFDDNGICNYYYEYKEAEKKWTAKGEEGHKILSNIAEKIIHAGKGKEYDSIIGLSGGVDSTYLAIVAKNLGLRPLAVHFDNGWNSEMAVKNIEGVVNTLGFDLFTYVIDWDEFRNLQLAYLYASVVDIEVLTDHAIIATLYKLANKHGIKYILSGANIQTENTLPQSWVFPKLDHRNILSINKEYGKKNLKNYPLLDAKSKRFYQQVKGITSVPLLNYIDYNKSRVKDEIKEKLGWRDYGGKHYESVWTRFYQSFILPRKFGIDKRKAHYSDLIFAGQLSKTEAIQLMNQPICDPKQIQEDFEFVIKKLELTVAEFNNIMEMAPRSHLDFDYDMPFEKRYPALAGVKKLYRFFNPLK